MKRLGKVEKILDLRSIWPHEAHDFSRWLSQEENLAFLGDAVGMDLELEEIESAVGAFQVDLFAREEGSNRKVIIENQLGDTNHDHLGKIITYASGKDAEVVIWIVKRARDEHRQAIQWLNDHTDENIGFFLLEIELWKIDDSLPAPMFNVVERPNDWVKTIKASEGLSETKKIQLDFWESFNQYAANNGEFQRVFSLRKPRPQHWYDLSVGRSSLHLDLALNLQKNVISAGIYVNNDIALYEQFKKQQKIMEEQLGMALTWKTATKDCRIIAFHAVEECERKANWNAIFDWYMEMALRLCSIVNQILS